MYTALNGFKKQDILAYQRVNHLPLFLRGGGGGGGGGHLYDINFNQRSSIRGMNLLTLHALSRLVASPE